MSCRHVHRMPEDDMGRMWRTHPVRKEPSSCVTVVQRQALRIPNRGSTIKPRQLLLETLRALSMKRSLLALAASLLLMTSLAACAPASEPVELSADTILIDVRTPGEYNDGHLNGAILLDLNGGQFAAALPTLDADAEYAVYCKSGNRSGQAVALMESAGFDNVIDLGSLGNATASTQIEIVQ